MGTAIGNRDYAPPELAAAEATPMEARREVKRSRPDVSVGDPGVWPGVDVELKPLWAAEPAASSSGPAPIDREMLALQHEVLHLHAVRLSAVDFAEVFSPARFTAGATALGLAPGSAFDLRTGWKLSLPAERRRCWARLIEEQPALVVRSPLCGPLSTLAELQVGHLTEENVPNRRAAARQRYREA